MVMAMHRKLQEIERIFHEGVENDVLCAKIDEAARLICALDERHPLREACEVFAPSLWGGASGSAIEPKVIQAVLGGPEGADYLRSWSGIGRAILAYRQAA